MKTALQELRDILENKSLCHEYGQSDYKDGLKVSLTTAITFIDYFIEKEKQQIIDAHFEGWSDAYDYLKDDFSAPRQAEDYYNETYNNDN